MVTRNCVNFRALTPFVTLLIYTEGTANGLKCLAELYLQIQRTLHHFVMTWRHITKSLLQQRQRNSSGFLHFKLQPANSDSSDCHTDIRNPFLFSSSLTPPSACRHCLRPEINSNKWCGWTQMSVTALQLFLLVTLYQQMSDILDKGVA
jgi:hypothetical protein